MRHATKTFAISISGNRHVIHIAFNPPFTPSVLGTYRYF